MGDSDFQTASSASRLGIRNTGGEIVEVQGGHIVRSTGRKDRHSKVCTAKGPRDRRVRLSAPTAIQFYDVQDRLGYDRPSKAVDWLIKKAKAAIDELAEPPAWNPTTTAAATATKATTRIVSRQENTSNERVSQFPMENLTAASTGSGSGGSNRRRISETTTTAAAMVGSDVHNLQQQQMVENPNNNSSFLPLALDSDSIAETIKSFFPMGASAETTSSSMQFPNYPPDLLSRTSSQNQDLRLSLQSFQDPILFQQQAHHGHTHAHVDHGQAQNEQQVLFSATANYLGFDGSSSVWSQHHPAEINRFQRIAAWHSTDTGNGGGSSGGGAGDGGFMFNTLLPPPTVSPPPPLLQPLFGQNQFFSQRGPLQSSNTSSVRAWIDPAITADHSRHQIPSIHQHQSAVSGVGFTSTGGGFSGFRVPARIQGEEEEHDSMPNKPSSASSDSCHLLNK